jgi:hypothetical protein
MLASFLMAGCHRASQSTQDPEKSVASLRKALDQSVAGSKSIFLPPGCLALLPGNTTVRHPSPEESAGALSSPAAFHALHRIHRFDRVFLLGGPSCSTLRDHLLESPVWVLSQVMPEGYLFAPTGSPPWHPPDASEAARLHPDPAERSLWLIATAENLIAIGNLDQAAALLNLSADSPEYQSRRLAALASLEATSGHWNKALDFAMQSLRLERRNRAATLILVRALTETGHTDEALSRARELASATPDAETLFLLARAANAAGDHSGEIQALQDLVALAAKQHQPSGASLLYLGQALARDGQRGEALRILEQTESAPELTEDQKKLIRELRTHLAPEKD